MTSTSVCTRPRTRAIAFAAILLLSACGGGGSDGGTPPAAGSPIEGAWGGTSSSGNVVEAIVLETGEAWAFTAVPIDPFSIAPISFTQGVLTTSGTSISGPDGRTYDFFSGTTITGNATGTFVAGRSINLTVTSSLGTEQIALEAADPADFDYNAPATAAAITGAWPGFTSDGDSGTAQVTATGSYSMTTAAGCSVSGTLTPRPSGKNVYNATANFGPAPCLLPNGSARGIAVQTVLIDGTAQLTVGLVTADRSLGVAFFASR